jgi:hypothetical protein
MKIKLIFSRTVLTPINNWDEFVQIEVEVPDYLAAKGEDACYQWHLCGSLTEPNIQGGQTNG